MSGKSSIDIKINVNNAIQDLRNRINPEHARWHSTHYFQRHLVYTALFWVGYLFVAPAIFLILFWAPLGVWGALGLWFIAGFFIVPGFLLLLRGNYYGELKVKKSDDKGIRLGTRYKHYVETSHFTDVVGDDDGDKAKPIMAGDTSEYILDYPKEPNPHAIILGGSGSGKTTTLRAFLIRAALEYKLRFLIIDWNGESEGWAQKINATVWKAGKQFKINPFMLRDASIADRASSIAELFQFGAHLTPLQSNMIRTIVLDHYAGHAPPTLMELWQDIDKVRKDRKATQEERQYANWIDQRLRTVQRVFGTEPEEFWNGMLTRNNIISLAGLNENEKSVVAYSVFQRIVEFFNKQPELNQNIRMLLVLDEAWAVLQSQTQGDQVFESLPSRIVRLGRKYGFGMVVSTQQMEDIPKPFMNSSAIRIIHNYRDASFLNSAKSVFGLGKFESAYLETAGIGEGFVFDQSRAQQGQKFADYVKVRQITEEELDAVKRTEKAYLPKVLEEPELPIDMAKTTTKQAEKVEERRPKTLHWPPPKDRPTPTQYIGLLAIFNNQGRKKVDITNSIKETGLIKANHTIYGSPGRPGIFETLLKLKLAEQSDDRFGLTDAGLRWVDPSWILETDKSRLGSTLHERILVETIRQLQKRFMLVVVPEPEDKTDTELYDCVDLVAYPIDDRRKYLWNDKARRGYEIQTTATKVKIQDHGDRADKYGLPLTWVSWNQEVLDAIKQYRKGKTDEYLLVHI
ncbi:MAG: DUF87 domain-containing protein [Candidatus Micrarchaeales archaeon]|nr:DUF87 domain-containing protein [Candidatus Micrarchaeales archaeon]